MKWQVVKHLYQSALLKINTSVTKTSLRSPILLTISYLFNQNVKKTHKKKHILNVHIYWKQILQRATIEDTRVLQILSEYLVHVRQTQSLQEILTRAKNPNK